ncbi:hypothetical protein P691DRAFT_152761 [Macrolepiota fuliginosa MF-IS2]|uniref:Secreted protein n=1 Tax=Macrolepiota fuliginosa MF-IS2 TaxID=1400762 RepID=A0A9P6C2S7_9AGAR|nr:hypothetical protein P691DRAFT_152761 [Macrolepiota fuliginosa MF-IS2]
MPTSFSLFMLYYIASRFCFLAVSYSRSVSLSHSFTISISAPPHCPPSLYSNIDSGSHRPGLPCLLFIPHMSRSLLIFMLMTTECVHKLRCLYAFVHT